MGELRLYTFIAKLGFGFKETFWNFGARRQYFPLNHIFFSWRNNHWPWSYCKNQFILSYQSVCISLFFSRVIQSACLLRIDILRHTEQILIRASLSCGFNKATFHHWYMPSPLKSMIFHIPYRFLVLPLQFSANFLVITVLSQMFLDQILFN